MASVRQPRKRITRLEAVMLEREIAASDAVVRQAVTDPTIAHALDAISALADARTDHPPANWNPGRLFDSLLHDLGREPDHQDYLDAWRIMAASETPEAAPHIRILDDAVRKAINR